ncbi:MAG: hypothetical protein LW884_09085 [Bacteroidetes bacterium]|jgi:hypothetical protein|nr:hypothetical protein [Bacteroidota bacterium]
MQANNRQTTDWAQLAALDERLTEALAEPETALKELDILTRMKDRLHRCALRTDHIQQHPELIRHACRHLMAQIIQTDESLSLELKEALDRLIIQLA